MSASVCMATKSSSFNIIKPDITNGSGNIDGSVTKRKRIFKFVSSNGLVPVYFFLLFSILVEAVLRWLQIPFAVAPLPSPVVVALLRDRAIIWPHLLVTSGEALVGFTGGTFLAVCTALFFVSSK